MTTCACVSNASSVSKSGERQLVAPLSYRRVTGYISAVSKFNDGKRAELRDRTKNIGNLGYQFDRCLT